MVLTCRPPVARFSGLHMHYIMREIGRQPTRPGAPGRGPTGGDGAEGAEGDGEHGPEDGAYSAGDEKGAVVVGVRGCTSCAAHVPG